MPITVVQGPAIPNYFGHPLNQAQKSAAQAVIAQLQYADLFLNPGTVRNSPLMRVDQQNPPPGRSNIQVQVNGVNGQSTVAHADFLRSLQTNNVQNQTGALNKVISALNQSLDTGRSYVVAGTNP